MVTSFLSRTIPLFGDLLKTLTFLTQFQENSNSSMSFSRHIRTRAFSFSWPKTRAMWVRKESKTKLSFLLSSALILSIYSRTLFSWFLICFWNYAFMHLHLSFMPSCCLSVFVWLFSFFFCLFFKIKIKIQKQCVFCVY